MAMLDNVVVSNALPRISSGLGAGMSGLQWVIEGYSLVYAALLLAGGTLGDRFGRRGFFLAGLALFTAGSMICGSAGTLAVLVAGRVVQGLGAAALAPQSLAILSTSYPDEVSRGRAIGVWSGVSALGLALGPAIGGPMVSAFGWQSIFWINVPVGVVGLALGLRVLPAVSGHPAGFDLAGQACVAVGLTAAVYALVEGPGRGWTTAPVLIGVAMAAGCLGAFVPIERAARSPMVDVGLFADRVFAGAAVSGFVVSFGMFGSLTYLGLYLQEVLGWSAAGAGVATLPATATIAVVAPVAGRLALRHGPRLPILAGLSCCAVGIGGLTGYGIGATYPEFCWLLPLVGTGMALSFAPISITVMSRVPARRAGMASATANTSSEVGGVAGIAVVGSILTARLAHLLPSRLAALGVPAPAPDRITHAVVTGGAHGLAGTGALPAPVRTAVRLTFTDGLHWAVGSAAVFLLVGAAAVTLLMPGRPSAVPAPATLAQEAGA